MSSWSTRVWDDWLKNGTPYHDRRMTATLTLFAARSLQKNKQLMRARRKIFFVNRIKIDK